MKGQEFWQHLVLSGLEKIIGDKFLARVINNDESDSLENYLEAKQMAEQGYAALKGWAI
jgi:hypothetical protein